MKRLNGKWALVTGSSRGIGQQIAMGLAREGANVIVHGRSKEHNRATLALVAPMGQAQPKRSVVGLDGGRLVMTLAVLARHAGLPRAGRCGSEEHSMEGPASGL